MSFFDIIPKEVNELILGFIDDSTTILGLYHSGISSVILILNDEHLQRLALLATFGRRGLINQDWNFQFWIFQQWIWYHIKRIYIIKFVIIKN